MMANYLGWKSFVISVATVIAFDLIVVSRQVPNDLLLYYDFDNMTESKVFDKSGNERYAEMFNKDIDEELGKCRKGISLNSRPLHITGRLNTSKSQLTVAAWIFLNEPQNGTAKKDRTIVTGFRDRTRSSDYNDLWSFKIDGKDDMLRWTFNSSKYKCKDNTSTKCKLKHGVWNHLAVTYNFTNGTERCTFFVNGTTFDGKTPSAKSGAKSLPFNYEFLIGSSDDTGKNALNGIMDEFYIFTKTLSKKEIEDLMSETLTCQEDPAPTSMGVLTTEYSKHYPTTTKMTETIVHFPTTTIMTESIVHSTTTTIMDSLQEKLASIGKYNSLSNDAIKYTEDVENGALALARKILKRNQSQTLETPDALLFMKIPISGFTFPSEEQKSAKNISESISFPDDLVKTEDGVQRAFVCIAYSNLHKRMAPEFTISSGSFQGNATLELSSKIIGAAVDPPLNKSLNNPITITFSHDQAPPGKQFCSFWNHSIRLRARDFYEVIVAEGEARINYHLVEIESKTTNESYGQWSTQGCELDEEHSSSSKTVCLCNHLTSFALLLQREGVPYSEPPLSLKIITIVGCSLSILACIVCFIMFLTLKKKHIRHYLHINLSFAIAVAQLILLFGISQTEYEILCKAMAACLHYFFMVAFLLMLSEGVHLAVLIETAFSHGKLKLPVYLITSWGLPLVIVGVTLGTRYDNYGGQAACFISAGGGTVYAFVGPFALILLINTVILVIVLRQVVNKTSVPISSQATSKFQIARATIRSMVMLFPVMGFTWIFGILFFGFRTRVLEYLFAIFCSLQGFFLFLFQYALNTESRLAFMRASRRLRLTFTSSLTTGATASHHDTMKQSSVPKVNISSPDENWENTKASSQDNCHLILYRPADGNTGSTVDSRTASTFI